MKIYKKATMVLLGVVVAHATASDQIFLGSENNDLSEMVPLAEKLPTTDDVVQIDQDIDAELLTQYFKYGSELLSYMYVEPKGREKRTSVLDILTLIVKSFLEDIGSGPEPLPADARFEPPF